MRNSIGDRVRKYLSRKKRKRRYALLMCLVSVVVAAGVYGLLMSPAEALNVQGIDLTPYITSADFESYQNGEWTDKDTYVSGESVRATLHYSIPEGVVSTGSRTLYYILPEGIAPLSGHLEGIVYSNDTGTDVRAGTYSIDTDSGEGVAVITIVLDETFVAARDSFTGSVWFDGRVTNTSTSDKTVTIDSTTITVTPPAADETQDIQTQKDGWEGEDSDGDGYPEYLEYKLTVSSTKGTGENVTIHDEFLIPDSDVTEIRYAEGSLKVTKKDAQGNESEVDGVSYNVNFTTSSSGNPCFDITGLPSLAAGESYTVSYRTDGIGTYKNDTDGSVEVKNSLTATAGDNTSNTWKTINITNGLINKYGNYNSSTGKVIWSVDIYPEGRQMKGYTLSDVLDGEAYTGEVTITRSDGKSVTTTLPYTFQEENTLYNYRITYSTDAGTELGVKVTNKVILTPPSDKDWPQASSESSVQTYETADELQKAMYGVYDQTESGAEYRWNVSLNVSASVSNTEFVYEDVITAGGDGTEGTDSENAEVHYITPALLKEHIDISGTTYGESAPKIRYQITEYRVNGKWTPASQVSDDTRTTGFRITFEAQEYDTNQLSITYHTAADYSSLQDGETGYFWNEGKAVGLSHKIMTEYGKEEENSLSKMVKDDSGRYTDADTTIQYMDGILHYRVFISLGEKDNGEITITDLLPSGAEYVEGSLTAGYYVNDGDIPKRKEFFDSYGKSQIYDFEGNQKPTVKINETSDGRKEAVITIQPGYNGYYDHSTGQSGSLQGVERLVLDFDVSVANDPLWAENKEIAYTNEVSWEGRGEAEQTTTVDRSGQSISKTGSQISGSDSDGNVVVEYRLDINCWGEMLGSDGVIELKDTLTADSQYVEPVLLTDSVALYRYDSGREDNLGERVLSTAWSFNYDSENKVMTIRVPDQTRFILVYRYQFEWTGGSFEDYGGTDHNVTNTLTLTNNQETGSTDQTRIQFEESGAWVAREPNLTVYKVDSDNYSIAIPDVEFRLEKLAYDENSGPASSWESTGIYTTDENGIIQFSSSEDSAIENKMERNVLYRLVETKASDGYCYDASDPLTVYFVWMQGKTSSDFSWISSLNEDLIPSVQKDQVHYIGASYGASLYVPNEYARLTVNKRWLDENGAVMTPWVDSVTVQLYQQAYRFDNSSQSMTAAGERTAYGEKVTLSSENSWTHYWDNLPKQDENGNEYRYFIEEDPVPGYTTETDHPNGVQTGTVTITNRFNGGAELPETGGIGRTPVYMTGTALLAAAGVALITGQQRRRRKEDGRNGRR